MKIEPYDAATRMKVSSENDNFAELPSDEDEPSCVDGAVLDPLPALIKFIPVHKVNGGGQRNLVFTYFFEKQFHTRSKCSTGLW